MRDNYIFKAKKFYKMTLSGSPALEGTLILENEKKLKNSCLSFPLNGIYISKSFQDMLSLQNINYISYSNIDEVKFTEYSGAIDFFENQTHICLRIICPRNFYEDIKNVILNDSNIDLQRIKI